MATSGGASNANPVTSSPPKKDQLRHFQELRSLKPSNFFRKPTQPV
jgi:hypothetical protein